VLRLCANSQPASFVHFHFPQHGVEDAQEQQQPALPP
jgi:hypothetical protein